MDEKNVTEGVINGTKNIASTDFSEDEDLSPEISQITHPKSKNGRMGWYDQLRGFVIIGFIIAIMNYPLSGDSALGILPVGSTFLNHGYRLAPSLFEPFPSSMPPPITLVDLGQGGLIFLIGFMQYLSVQRRKKVSGRKEIIGHSLQRFSIFLILSVVFEDIFYSQGLQLGLFTGTLALIAWASLFSGIVSISTFTPKLILIVAAGLFTIQSGLLYVVPLREWSIGSGFYRFEFPWKLISLTAVTFCGVWCAQALFDPSGNLSEDAFKTKFWPFTVGTMAVTYISDYFLWADFYSYNLSLSCLAMFATLIQIFIFYQLDRIGFHLPILDIFGKNMMAVFLLTPGITYYIAFFGEKLMRGSRFWGLILGGILPIALLGCIAWILSKKKWIIKI